MNNVTKYPVISIDQMRRIDQQAINGNAEVGFDFMQQAAEGLLHAVQSIIPSAIPIAIVCGKGNNGGDGFLLAHLLKKAGYTVHCFGLFNKGLFSPDAQRACDVALQGDVAVSTIQYVDELKTLSAYGLIVDAILGSGSKGNPTGLAAEAITAINSCGVPVLAVDMPSGLDADTGVPGTPCITAHTTVTMGFAKPGLLFYPGRLYTGKLIVHKLCYPQEIVNKNSSLVFLPDVNDLRALLPARKPWGSKFDHGVVTAMCGSTGMTGAPVLVAQAALRSGCGMVHLAIPADIVPAIGAKLIEPVLHALPQTDTGSLSMSAQVAIEALCAKANAVCVGPGLSHDQETMSLVRSIIASLNKPIVLDADGINAFKDHSDELKRHAGPMIMTPHSGEWTRLFGNLPDAPLQKIERLRNVACEYSLYIVIKGSPTLYANPTGDVFILPFGNSALAKAGSGDVLSGIIASFIAQGCTCNDAAILGVYIHGMAGTIMSEQFTEYGVLAQDIVLAIPLAIRRLLAIIK